MCQPWPITEFDTAPDGPNGEFDAELYLRLVGERALLGRAEQRGAPWDSPLASAAGALVAVGAIDEHSAGEVVDYYALAEALRSPESHPGRRRLMVTGRAPPAPATPAPLSRRRVVAVDREIPSSGGTLRVRHVILGDDVTRVAISFRAPGSGRGRSRRMFLHAMAPAGGVPFGRPGGQQLTLADDRGTSAAAHFSGGGDDREWRGQLEATAPLAADTAWIELDGERIELDDAAPEVEVSVEGIPGESPAVRHLWHLVASRRHHMASSDTAQPAIDALVACGALDPADPAIDEAQAAREAIAHGPMGSGPGAPRLPDPWASLLARRTSADGPSGTVVLGAVTPPFDGIGVAVSVLESSAEGWTIEVEVAPDVVMMDRPFGPRGTGSGLTWWARDNRGNHYLGAPGQWSGHGDRGSGEIGFWPALDPQATELVLMPTGERERAVIRTALAWNAGADVAG